ncbi:MAG: FCD domain-containing protein [Candidatus Aminicenantes bacterium]|nr:FCD domain-containing protein [Candidatus Aminicenantes bacterium]
MKDREPNSLDYKIPETLGQSIYNCLKKAIIENKIEPNQRINEKEIADSFKVSRTPVREALVRLEAEGFTKIKSHRDVVVKEVSYGELAEFFQVIGILDSLAVSLVADKIDPKELIKIDKLTAKLQHCYNQKEVEKFIDVNHEIHDRIWNHLTNKYLQKSLRQCLVHIKRCNYALNSAFYKKEILDASMKAHKRILEALNKKDKEKLKNIIKEHWNPPLL